MSRLHFPRTLLSLLAALGATALMAVPLGPPPALAAKQKPKVTKIKHVGSFDEWPDSQVSFTLVKRGKVLVKAVNVRISGVRLYCFDANHQFSEPSYTTTFPGARIGTNAFGEKGFAIEDMPLTEYEWGFKRFAAFLGKGGRSAHGDARIRWEHQGGVCNSGIPTWTSHAL